jgi:hypothetical protein
MGAVTTADQVVREDLSNLFINLDERDTPFLTKLKRARRSEQRKVVLVGA